MEWHNDVRLLRKMRELWDPVRQLITMPVQKPKLTNDSDNYKPYTCFVNPKMWKEAQCKAYVIHPMDYADGVLTHSNCEVDGWEEAYNALDKTTEYMIGDNKFFTKNTEDGDHAVPGVIPIGRNDQLFPILSKTRCSNTFHRIRQFIQVKHHTDYYRNKIGDM